MLEIETPFPVLAAAGLPDLTAAEMAEVDRLAVERFGIDLNQMVEQAGSHLAELVRVELGGDLRGGSVVVAVGPGNNGAGSLAASRHLANRGASVRVVLARPVVRLTPAARHQLETLLEMAVECCVAVYDIADEELDVVLAGADVIVDAVLGYGGRGEPRGEVGWLIARIAQAGVPIISLDMPSGLDADSGEVAGIAVTAAATLTLGLQKPSLLTAAGREHAGRLYLADIGLPAALYTRLGIDVGAPFASRRVVRLDLDASL